MSALDLWRDLAAWTGLVVWVTFVAAYSLLARWWRSPEGRNVWMVGCALIAAFAIIVAAYTWPDYWLRPYLVPALYTIIAALGVQRTVQMIVRQRRRRRDDQH